MKACVPFLPGPGRTTLRPLFVTHRSVVPPPCPRLGMATVIQTMGMENEWKMISCVGLTTSSLLPQQVPSSWVKRAFPPQEIPALIFLALHCCFLQLLGNLKNREEKENNLLQPYLLVVLEECPTKSASRSAAREQRRESLLEQPGCWMILTQVLYFP